MISEQLQSIPVVAGLEAWSPGVVIDACFDRGQLAVGVNAERIEPVCRFLKSDQGYRRLSFVTAVDWYPLEPRFEAVYCLHSFDRNHWLRVKCRLPGENPELDSVTTVWPSANWYEREVFDLFGIRFRRHPDLRHIMMPEAWEGHPLRKDYPLRGTP